MLTLILILFWSFSFSSFFINAYFFFIYLCLFWLQIPFGFEISDPCRDLLLGLLERDPDKRMSYDEFLDHPFIDLKHRPSSNALKTAVIYIYFFLTCSNGTHKSCCSFLYLLCHRIYLENLGNIISSTVVSSKHLDSLLLFF